MLLGSGEDDGAVSPGLFCVWHTAYHDRLLLHRHLMSLLSLCLVASFIRTVMVNYWGGGGGGGAGLGLRAYATRKRKRGMERYGQRGEVKR